MSTNTAMECIACGQPCYTNEGVMDEADNALMCLNCFEQVARLSHGPNCCASCGTEISGYQCKPDGSQAIFLCFDCLDKSIRLLDMGIKPSAIAQNNKWLLLSVQHLVELREEQKQRRQRIESEYSVYSGDDRGAVEAV